MAKVKIVETVISPSSPSMPAVRIGKNSPRMTKVARIQKDPKSPEAVMLGADPENATSRTPAMVKSTT
jgi:hypothetical protein